MNKKWLKAAGVRAIKTMAESALAVIGTGVIGIMDINWITLLSIVVMSGVTSMLISIKGLPEVEE